MWECSFSVGSCFRVSRLDLRSGIGVKRDGLVLVGSCPMEENSICQFTLLGIELGEQAKICVRQILYFFSLCLEPKIDHLYKDGHFSLLKSS
ncbi:hypothetical protein R3W88_016630 [Solanum pinnatisectum]|uniref:Uncharacterized protein n=1 Tax=Solanum pinnatisectum TaxID=50273 RepID=A0AAV9KZ25_9SOLN|nr:hypothetical protein R3W88_016630 [Solanum pinnatisectum]